MRFRFLIFGVLLVPGLVELAVAPTANEARAGMSALVPAYFYPGTGGAGGVGDGWAQMADAASTIGVTAIFNPNSGPVPGDQPNSDYVAAITKLENAGGSVIAYIPTAFGNEAIRPISTVEGYVDTYLKQYGGLIKGFFIDEMSTLSAKLPYYQQLYTYIKGLDPNYQVFGNPGIPFNNAEAYLKVADNLVIYEGPFRRDGEGGPSYVDTIKGDGTLDPGYPYGINWFDSGNYPSNRFTNLVYSTSTVADMLAGVRKAYGLNTRYAYFTDDTLPNPWDTLPSYWNEEVHALASVPEPSSLVAAAACGLVGLVVAAIKRRSPAEPN